MAEDAAQKGGSELQIAPRPDISIKALLAELGECRDEASRESVLESHPELLRIEVVSEIADTVRKELRIDVHLALRLADAGLTIARRVGDRGAIARSIRAKANALWLAGEYRLAVEEHDRALKLFEDLEEQVEVGRTLSASIQPLILIGEYERALAAGDRAREIFKTLGDQLRIARLEINIGNIYHRQDRVSEALHCYQEAYSQLRPDKDIEGIASALHNIAVCFISLNECQNALSTYKECRDFCIEHGMPLAVVQADYNIAFLHYLRGEYSRAIDMLRATRAASHEVKDRYHAALCDLDLSEIYLELNLSEEAAETAEAGHTQFQCLGLGYETAKTLANLAIALGQQGKAFRALEVFTEAREIFVREKNRIWPWLIDLYQAVVLLDEGRLFESGKLCTSALECFNSSVLPTKTALCHLLLARLSLKRGLIDEARRSCDAALGLLKGLEAPVLDYQAQFLMGQIEESIGNVNAAYRWYLAAHTVLETLRGGLRGEELKISFMKNRLEVYENLVNLCLNRHPPSPEEAWGYMEQAKSRALRDLVHRRGHPLPPVDPGQSDLVRRVRDLREELNWYYHRIEAEQLRADAGSAQQVERLRAGAWKREKEFSSALRELPASDAETAGFDVPAAVSLSAIQRVIGAKTVIVEYFRVRDRFFATLITQDCLEVVPLTIASRVVNLQRLLRFQLSKFRLGPEYVNTHYDSLLKATQGHLQGLYNEVVAPIRSRLNGQHLVIIPHDSLHYLPFHAFYDGERYLSESFTISYAPSATVYALVHERPANTSGNCLVVGVPDPRTPSIREEVAAVAEILPDAELLWDEDATEDKLREKGQHSRLIHIATHGFFREDNPMFSGIKLKNTHLSLFDLNYMKLPAELIVLSGCSTGSNVVAAGDELLGLTRGLLGAGAQSLLLTLWDVHDESTSEFMRTYYSHLQAEGNKALALQAAMRDHRQRFPHPFHWAPFILIGKVFPT